MAGAPARPAASRYGGQRSSIFSKSRFPSGGLAHELEFRRRRKVLDVVRKVLAVTGRGSHLVEHLGGAVGQLDVNVHAAVAPQAAEHGRAESIVKLVQVRMER